MADAQKYALITGATSGIGLELAKLFAQDKYNLVLVARSEEELASTSSQLSQQYGVQVNTIAKDLFKREAPFEVYEEVKAKGIQIDALVNDAGQGQYGKFTETDINRELDIIQLNIGAYVVLTKFFLKEMVARNEGKILQVSSIGGELPGPLQSVYHGTKAFVTSFTEAIRAENKDTNIAITALLPGVTDTDFFDKADMEDSKLVQEGSKADPAKVAKDGYEALLANKDKIISGFKNKAQVAMSNLMPDDMVANNMLKQGEPINKSE
ncbi:SDR family oxidoreductase [Hymenobacter sp. GOD-10R]|uniref:SDR family NAD(P)-dependent oxidoreductase n=1 Tax=Hymenobacter sp. GOD-10R TaxID=3093922 RepID=UPI002D77C01C|nr:SDR family oxidoreductase [Hymenobacter sp. GOD-10R]WRQ30332.1 SDR family oxidoreductase [Hymenobacter sp. GOD-10R]